MNNIIGTSPPFLSTIHNKNGFSLIELMVAIAVVAILTTLALPSMNTFLVKMRIDNEISELQKILLTARNTAINTGKITTVCPLTSGVCTTNWQNDISVFTNSVNTLANGTAFTANDELVKIKESIKDGDKLQFANTSVIYNPAGQLLAPTVASTFNYCAYNDTSNSRSIDLSISGRSYVSSDIDNDGKDENRNGNEIVCN
jgi:type IV fimbrial biogenesis protein FimT/type IV fimbrial biogenesis protein FimU